MAAKANGSRAGSGNMSGAWLSSAWCCTCRALQVARKCVASSTPDLLAQLACRLDSSGATNSGGIALQAVTTKEKFHSEVVPGCLIGAACWRYE